MIEKLKAFWHSHGTKFWGYFVIFIGVAGDSLVYLQALDPKHAAVYSAMVAVGGAIVRRGYSNSSRPTPDTVAKVAIILCAIAIGVIAPLAYATEVPIEKDSPKIEGHPLTSVLVTQCNQIVVVYMSFADGRLLRFDKSANIPSGELMQMAYSAIRSERVEVSCNETGVVGYEKHEPV